MKTKRIIAPILALSLYAGITKAQDIHFSMFTEMPSSINPAIAGVNYNLRVTGNYRSQWSSVASKFETMGLSYEQTIRHKKLKSNYFAFNINIFKDLAGDAKLSTLNPNVGISYHQKITKQMKFSGGIQSGFMYRTIDVSNLTWDRQFDGFSYNPSLSSGEDIPNSGVTSFDLGGGVNFNYNAGDKFAGKSPARFDVGLSAYHYQLAKNSFINSTEKLQTRICGYFSGEISIPNSINAIAPSVLYMRQGPSSELIAGALFKFIIGDPSTYTSLKKPRAFGVGGYYRYKDAIIPSILFQYNKYAIGVAYDINVSALTPATNRYGAFEVMLRYNMWPGYGVNLGRRDTKPSY
jgi:type IX secretion system PorP/SprF family membrane protein